MSGSSVTIGGGFNGQSGILGVPSNFPSAVNTLLQDYLNGISAAVTATTGGAGFINDDVAANQVFTLTGGAGLEVISDTDSTGASTIGAGSNTVTASDDATTLVVEAPGDLTVAGSSSTTSATFGADSNVNYSVNDGQGTIFAAGGDNMISAGGSSNLDIFSAGNDTVDLNGTNGNSSVNAEGNATTTVFVGGSDAATVTASNSATASVVFLQRSGGNLDFINNSTAAQTVFSGSFTVEGGASVFAPNSVTAFGGAGGGFFVGGRAGNNSLVGGVGAVTLQGAGNGDFLEANASTGAANQLFGGAGFETLMGSSTSGSNVFQLGLPNTGIGDVTTGGIASTNGSGQQSFLIGNAQSETLTGSSATGAFNTYDIIGDSTTGGSNITITNFNPANSVIFLTNDTTQGPSDASVSAVGNALGGGAQILLSDGTTITLKGVSAVSLNAPVSLSGGVVGIN
jgi:hypothetical protein